MHPPFGGRDRKKPNTWKKEIMNTLITASLSAAIAIAAAAGMLAQFQAASDGLGELEQVRLAQPTADEIYAFFENPENPENQ